MVGPAVLQKQMNNAQNDCACGDNETGLGMLSYAAQTEMLHYDARVHSSGRDWQTIERLFANCSY